MTNYAAVKNLALARKTARLWMQKLYPKQGTAKLHTCRQQLQIQTPKTGLFGTYKSHLGTYLKLL